MCPIQRGPAMKPGKMIFPFILATILLVGISAGFSAEKEMTDQKKDPWAWRFNLNAYGWIPWAPADIRIGENEAHIPEDATTIFQSLRMALMFEAEVHKGPIGVFISPLYVELDYSENKSGPIQKVTLQEQAWLIDYGGAYSVWKWKFGKSSTFDIGPYAAGRWFHDNIKIEFKPGPTISKEVEFNTPVVGFRGYWDFGNPWLLKLVGDYGGFGIDNVDQTFQVFGSIGYRFKIKEIATRAFLGFRWVNIEYSKEDVDLKVDIYGPYLGMGIEF